MTKQLKEDNTECLKKSYLLIGFGQNQDCESENHIVRVTVRMRWETGKHLPCHTNLQSTLRRRRDNNRPHDIPECFAMVGSDHKQAALAPFECSLIVQSKTPHNITETLLKPACIKLTCVDHRWRTSLCVCTWCVSCDNRFLIGKNRSERKSRMPYPGWAGIINQSVLSYYN